MKHNGSCLLWRLFESSVGDGRDGINETLCLLEGLGGGGRRDENNRCGGDNRC